MSEFIIRDNFKGILNFGLRDILQLLKDAEKFHWTLSGIELNVLQPKINQTEITEEELLMINQFETVEGKSLSWSELLKLTRFNIQIINGNFYGENDGNFIRITAVDSSYWSVETNIKELEIDLKKRFENILNKT